MPVPVQSFSSAYKPGFNPSTLADSARMFHQTFPGAPFSADFFTFPYF